MWYWVREEEEEGGKSGWKVGGCKGGGSGTWLV